MKVCKVDNLIYAKCDSSEKSPDWMRRKGWVWNSSKRVWATPYAEVAGTVLSDDSPVLAKLKYDNAMRRMDSVSDGCATGGYTPNDKKARAYQNAGVAFAMHPGHVLIGDDMGLGKTIQAIMTCNVLNPRNVLIICPASVKNNWANEWRAWSTNKHSIGIAQGSFFPDLDRNVVIINYDILHCHMEQLLDIKWGVMIIDEAQYLKNPEAQRTKNVLGFGSKKSIRANKILALTGTPIPNRPIELYPLVKRLSPQGFGTEMSFAKRYCDAHFGDWGWVKSGASNLDELQHKLRSTIMVRRLKKDVLPELPAKRRQILELDPSTLMKKYLSAERKMTGTVSTELTDKEYRALVRMMSGISPEFGEMSKLRAAMAMEKMGMVIDHLEDAIEASGKVVVFVHHANVACVLASYFGHYSVMLTGKTQPMQRQGVVNKFQNDKDIKLFIGNIEAAGVGITLTASSHVVFAEFPWSPEDMTQCEDRTHRIGQKDSVLVQYLVMKGSLDATMVRTMVRKQEVIAQVVNVQKGSELDVWNEITK